MKNNCVTYDNDFEIKYKKCSFCKKIKPEFEFHTYTHTIDTIRSKCLVCRRSEKVQEQFANNKLHCLFSSISNKKLIL